MDALPLLFTEFREEEMGSTFRVALLGDPDTDTTEELKELARKLRECFAGYLSYVEEKEEMLILHLNPIVTMGEKMGELISKLKTFLCNVVTFDQLEAAAA